MNEYRMKDMLDNLARRGVPENIDLWPNIAAHIERQSPMMTFRTRPLVAILMALLALLVVSSAVYALGRMLGFIPGIGMVEQTSSLRTLAGPAIAEREGIRLTVMNVIASPSGTSVRFQVEWLTPPPATGDPDTSCQGTPSMILPDGTQLSFIQTIDKFTVGGPGSNAGYGYVMEFAPVPEKQSDVTFVYPCINPIVPGPLPRDWQIPMHLIPAPGGMVLPVVTVPATETITPATDAATLSTPTSPAADPTHRISLSLDSFVPMNDGYLLTGSLQWNPNDYPAYGVKPMPFRDLVVIVDASGQAVPWEEVYGNVKPQNEEYRSYWAIKVLSTTFAPPLTITHVAADVQIQPVSFRFDAGPAPQVVQSWDVDQEVRIVDSTVHVEKASLVSSDGNLNFHVDVQVDASSIGDLHINTILSQCMGGGGGYPVERLSTLQIYVPLCRADLPPGIVEMQVTGAVLWGEWQVTWQP